MQTKRRSKKKSAMKSKYRYYFISLLIVFLDQLTKYVVRLTIPLNSEPIKLTPNFFWLTHVQNTGAAFSLSLGSPQFNRIFFIFFSLIVIVILVFMQKRTKIITEKIAYSFILGGAIGNLIDRIFIGGVTDFIWWDFPDFIMERWPVFNIADSSIVVALTLLIVYYIFFEKKKMEDK
jgi:signal peptidase II